jgi:hypothetical protein
MPGLLKLFQVPGDTDLATMIFIKFTITASRANYNNILRAGDKVKKIMLLIDLKTPAPFFPIVKRRRYGPESPFGVKNNMSEK